MSQATSAPSTILRFAADRDELEPYEAGWGHAPRVVPSMYPPRTAVGGAVLAGAGGWSLVLALKAGEWLAVVPLLTLTAAGAFFAAAGLASLFERRGSSRRRRGVAWPFTGSRTTAATCLPSGRRVALRWFAIGPVLVAAFGVFVLAAGMRRTGFVPVMVTSAAVLSAALVFSISRSRYSPMVSIALTPAPAAPGSPLTARVTIRSDADGAPFDRLSVRLECVRERVLAFGFLGVLRTRVSGVECRLDDELPGREFTADFDFVVPADALTTDLTSDPAVYWDLVVEGDGRTGPHRYRALAPIFAVETNDPYAPSLSRSDASTDG